MSFSIIWRPVEDPLAYRVDAVLRQFVGPFRHYFSLAGIGRDNFDVENAGIGTSRFHAKEGWNIFFIGRAPDANQLRKSVYRDKAKVPLLSATVTGRCVAAFVEDLLLNRG